MNSQILIATTALVLTMAAPASTAGANIDTLAPMPHAEEVRHAPAANIRLDTHLRTRSPWLPDATTKDNTRNQAGWYVAQRETPRGVWTKKECDDIQQKCVGNLMYNHLRSQFGSNVSQSRMIKWFQFQKPEYREHHYDKWYDQCNYETSLHDICRR